MKKLILSLVILIAILFSTNSYSQNIDSVLAKYSDAIGGRSNWDAVKTLKFTGYSNIMGMDIPFTQYVKRPGLWMIEIQVQGMKIIQCYDGTGGWMINPMMGSKKPSKTDDATTKSFKANSLIGGKLMNIKEMGYTVVLEGKEDLEGKEVYKLKLTDKDGEETIYFIDAASFLILNSSGKITRMGNEITTESTYSNYTKVENILIAFFTDQKLSGTQIDSQSITIDKVEVNVNIDDKIFKMPAE
jgi:outer membrane lipoprotein-sorting protein